MLDKLTVERYYEVLKVNGSHRTCWPKGRSDPPRENTEVAANMYQLANLKTLTVEIINLSYTESESRAFISRLGDISHSVLLLNIYLALSSFVHTDENGDRATGWGRS